MEIKDFKKYCSEKVAKLNLELASVRESIQRLPKAEDILLPVGNEFRQLKYNYSRKNSRSFRRRIFGVSKIDLQKFMLKRCKDDLANREKTIISKISELQRVDQITEENLSSLAGENNGIIRYVLDYSMEKEIDIDELITFLIGIFKTQDRNSKNIFITLEYELALQFNDDGTVSENSLKSVLFMFKKLFENVFKNDLDNYQVIVNRILERIKSRCLGSGDEKSRASLEEQKAAIEKLHEYIEGTTIVKVADNIEEFQRLLEVAGVEDGVKETYVKSMKTLMQQEEDKHNEELLRKYLTPEEVKVIEKALVVSAGVDIEEQRDLIDRLIKDIKSICKYMDIGLVGGDVNEVREALYTKMILLNEQIGVITNPPQERSAFKYVVCDNGVPRIIRNLEGMDTIGYGTVYEALRALYQKKGEDVPAFRIEDIDFYLYPAYDSLIVYAIVRGVKVLVGATVTKDVKGIQEEVPTGAIEQLRNMLGKEDKPEDVIVHQNYENLLIKLLDLDNVLKNKTLKKS